MELSKMGYKMATKIKCLAIGEQYCYAKLTGPYLIISTVSCYLANKTTKLIGIAAFQEDNA